ncbi:MAG: hypothetical protein RLN76_05690 [Phycisphaeraceae bacterium]
MPTRIITPILATLALTSVSSAVILEDFRFDDPNGTELGAAANAINPTNLWQNSSGGLPIPGDVADSTVQDGVFRIAKADDLFSTRHLQIDDITSGVAYLVADVAGWNVDASNFAELEDVGWALLNNDTGFNGSTITAQMRLVLFTPTQFLLEGSAIGGGSSSLPQSTFLPINQPDPVKFVLKLDRDLNQYEVLYQIDGGAINSVGVGNLGIDDNGTDGNPADNLTRDGNSIRWRINNNFGSVGEFFDVDRVYLTTSDPFAEGLFGDFDDDGTLDPDDIDLLVANLGDPAFDIDGDNDADADDLNEWVTALAGTFIGDSNLDGEVDLIDLSALASNFNGTAGWAGGNFNTDTVVDLIDLSLLASNFGSSTTIPEPTALALLGLGLTLTTRRNA